MLRRLLLLSPMHTLQFSTLVFAMLAVFSVFSIIAFLCGTKIMKKLHTETEETTGSKVNKLVSKLNRSNLSSRAVSMVKMLSWRKVRSDEGEEEEVIDYSNNQDDDEEALWRKNILMGEKCRPLDSEGEIMVPPDLSQQDRHR